MRRIPFIGSMAYMPLSYLTDSEVRELKDFLTIVYTPMNSDTYVKVYLYSMTVPGYIGLPRYFAKKNFPDIKFVNRTVAGVDVSKAYVNKAIKPRDDLQRDYMQQLADVCNKKGPLEYVANAGTGTGKTVADLKLNIELGVPTLVILHRQRLVTQWHERINMFFGKKWAQRWVGHVQQDKCVYKGKAIVLGMLQSLSRRDYGLDFKRYFGRIVWDEIHKMAAPAFSTTACNFPARIKCGMTATNRDDVLQRVLNFHFGPPAITSGQKSLDLKVYILKYKKKCHFWNGSKPAVITGLTRLECRNRLLVKLIKDRGLKRGRNIMLLSDRTAHLVTLRDMLIAEGVSPEIIGIYAGSYETGEFILKQGKNKLGPYSKQTLETQKKIKSGWVVKPVIHKPDNDELNFIEDKCQVILATYGIFDTGIDIARLDMGIEGTPRGKLIQPMGRVLRQYPDKPVPEWYGVDDNIYFYRKYDNISGGWELYKPLHDLARFRMESYREQEAKIKVIDNAA